MTTVKHGNCAGYESTPTYKVWSGMKTRCLNPNDNNFKRYGAKGITICERWVNSFANFLFDMGERPPGLTLDRKDPKGNYEPSNCRWATYAQQNLNRTDNRKITIGGETKCLIEWCRHFGILSQTVAQREKNGWEVIKALTTPVSKKFSRFKTPLPTLVACYLEA